MGERRGGEKREDARIVKEEQKLESRKRPKRERERRKWVEEMETVFLL